MKLKKTAGNYRDSVYIDFAGFAGHHTVRRVCAVGYMAAPHTYFFYSVFLSVSASCAWQWVLQKNRYGFSL